MIFGHAKIFITLALIQQLYASTTDDRSAIHDQSATGYAVFSTVSIGCVLFGGLMSGLTVGLLGIDELELEIKISSGTPKEKSDAKKILSVVNHHHLLLVTLLLANSLAMEALPLFLDEIFNTEITVAISVTFVLAFGEVIPQAICTGPNQIKIARMMVPFVKFLIILLLPITYPIAKLLDCVLDQKDGIKLKSDDLKTFLTLHENASSQEIKANDDTKGLEKFQITMMHGIIDLNKARAKKYMRPYKEFLSLDIEVPISESIVDKIVGSYYYALPVFRGSKSNLVGVIKIQELFKIWEGDTLENADIFMQDPVYINSKMTLLSALKEMEAAQSTISFAIEDVDGKKKIVGVLTKEIILSTVLLSNSESDRSEIADISHALVDTLGHESLVTHKSSMYPFKEKALL